jgi:uncharacterized membrane protein YbaN (DUF454 family)
LGNVNRGVSPSGYDAEMDNVTPQTLAVRPIACRPVRYATLAAGVICVGLGILGLFLPVMPTTVFLLIALWCFSHSSERLQRWLYDHPRLGRGLRSWHRHRVIPRPAKIAALATMAASLVVTALLCADTPALPAFAGLAMAGVAIFILRCPSRVSDRSN